MKRILLSFVLMLSLVLPFSLMAIPVAAEATEGEIGEEEEQTYRKDTVILDHTVFKAGSIVMSPSSGSATDRWNKRVGGTLTPATDPFDETNSVLFAGGTQTASVQNNKLIKNNTYPDPNYPTIFACNLLLPSSAQSEIGIGVTAFTVKLFGVDIVTVTREDDLCRVSSPVGTIASFPTGSWVRLTVTYAPEDHKSSVTLIGTLTNAQGDACDKVRVDGIANAGSTAELQLSYGIPAQTGETALTYGMLLDNIYLCHPGDFYLESAALDPYVGDKHGNLKLDGNYTMNFSHDLEITDEVLNGITVTDEAGNLIPYTAVNWSASAPRQLVISFAEDPLPTHTVFTVDLGEGLRDFCGQSLFGGSVLSFATYGTEGEVRPKIPVETLPTNGLVMPDAYNTGYRCAEEELALLTEKYPNLSYSGTGVTITDDNAEEYGYRFSGFKHTGMITVKCTQDIVIEDALLVGNTFYCVSNGGTGHLTLSYVEGTGVATHSFNRGNNMTLSHCYIHDVGADHLKAGKNLRVEHCYLTLGGQGSPLAHADGIQFSGTPNEVLDNVVFYGNRVDLPQLKGDGVANAAFFFKPEQGTLGYSNVRCVGNWLNGGGYTVYWVGGTSGIENMYYLTYSNNITGYGYAFKNIIFNGWSSGEEMAEATGGEYTGNTMAEHLAAGSVLLFDGAGNRVGTLADITDGTVKVSVNMANYLLEERNYRLEAQIYSANGALISKETVNGSVNAYIGYKQYATADNIYTKEWVDSNGTTYTTEYLKELPNEPVNVLCDLTLAGVPADLSGCTLELVAYDTTGTETYLRSAVFTDTVADNTLTALSPFHTVTVEGKDGETLATLSVCHGCTPNLPDPPAVAGYRFLAWEGDYQGVTDDITVRAVYVSETKLIVRFLDRDGAVLKTETVDPGGSATAPTPPTLRGYTFTSWSCSFENVTEDLTVQAIYTPIPTYTVTFLDKDGNTLKTETVYEGEGATAPEPPFVRGFVFSRWSQAYDRVTENLTVRAEYTEARSFTVTFTDKDGGVLKTEVLYEGESATPPTPPTVEGYTFVSWSGSYENVTENLTIAAQYRITVTVTFDSAGGSTVPPSSGAAGAPLTAPATPTREGYVFDGWYHGDTAYVFSTYPEDSLTLTAHWSPDMALFAGAMRALQAANTPEKQFAALKQAQAVLDTWGGDASVLAPEEKLVYDTVLASYRAAVAHAETALPAAEKTGDALVGFEIAVTAAALIAPAALYLGKRRFF